MPYIEAKTVAGRTVLYERYFTSRYNNGTGSRCKNEKELDEAHKMADMRKEVKKLTLLMNANFGYGDYHLVLTYEKAHRPHTPQEAKEDRQKFIRNISTYCKRKGIQCKYIIATEYGKVSALHHHAVINKEIPIHEIQKRWKKGRCQFRPLDEDGEYSQLASYFLKYREYWKAHGGKGWQYSHSRNLIVPKTVKRTIKNRGGYYEKPRPKKGYYIKADSVFHGYREDGWPIMSYIMVKEDNGKRGP